MLSAGQRHPPSSIAVLLEDRSEALEAMAEAAPEEAPAGEQLEQAVAREDGLARHRDLHAGAAAGDLGEAVVGDLADAVELPPATAQEDAVGALGLGDRHVRPAEADERRLDAETGSGADPDALLAGQVPVLEEVVGELRVVGHVGEVVEDLLARLVDDDVDGDRVHGPAV